MSRSKITINFERPDFVSKKLQGRRGPFAPILMGLEYLIQLNKWQLRQKNYPLLYKSGIYYHTENHIDIDLPEGLELTGGNHNWYDIPTLLQEGRGDCKNLVAYRIAELSHYYNIEAKPLIKWKWTRYNNHRILLIHVILQWPNGQIEDPSKILGMGGEYT